MMTGNRIIREVCKDGLQICLIFVRWAMAFCYVRHSCLGTAYQSAKQTRGNGADHIKEVPEMAYGRSILVIKKLSFWQAL